MDGVDFRGKQVLVVGLGRLGGGAATARWFAKQGAKVTVTDLKTREELADSVAALGDCESKIGFVLGEHREADFRSADLVVVNPAVPRASKFLKLAREAGAEVTNDARIFFERVRNPIIAVTGTRGKTTTANWIAHFLRARWPDIQVAGNTPENPLLKAIDSLEPYSQERTPVVVELSSWQLEFLDKGVRGPDLAVITNLYRDHMNRYASMKEYAEAKASIFKSQTSGQYVIYGHTIKNRVGIWDEMERAASQKINYETACTNPLGFSWKEGGGEIYASFEDVQRYIRPLGWHNVSNAAAAVLAAVLTSRMFSSEPLTPEEIVLALSNLSAAIPRFRQEAISDNGRVLVINDSTSTTPVASLMALRRFADAAIKRKASLFFIAGGTDKEIDYAEKVNFGREGGGKGNFVFYIRVAMQRLRSHGLGFHLYLLDGSATKKMQKGLDKFSISAPVYQDLEAIVKEVKRQVDEAGGGVVVFSPGAASFGSFKNEFDRGDKFNLLIKKYFKM